MIVLPYYQSLLDISSQMCQAMCVCLVFCFTLCHNGAPVSVCFIIFVQVELLNILRCHKRKHCIEPVMFKIEGNKYKDVTFTITIDADGKHHEPRPNWDITKEEATSVISTDSVVNLEVNILLI